MRTTTGADAVLATAADADLALDHNQVRLSLTSTGWHFADKTASGAPSPATLEALLAVWRSVVAGS